jgi:urea transport system ATP-binding protein
VVRGASGAARPGEVLCVLGRNGVGKSTLMKALCGFLPCWRGQLRFDGTDLTAIEPARRRRLGITYCPQERPVFDNLSVQTNLLLMGPDRSIGPLKPYFERFPVLERRLAQLAGTLSGGEKKILSFVRGLAENQRLVVLDEPSEGVQWENILHMEAVIAERKRGGCAFVVVEQNIAFAERIADRYLVMDHGEIVFSAVAAEADRARLLSYLQV